MDQFKKNLDYLKAANSSIYQTINNHLNKNSKYALSYEPILNIQNNEKNKFMYSKYDPVNEAKIWASSIKDLQETETVALFGLGLTYHLAALLEENPNLKLMIYEPDVDIFIEMLKVVDIEQLVDHPSILVIEAGQQHLESFIENYEKYCAGKSQLLVTPYYFIEYKETYLLFQDKINQAQLNVHSKLGFKFIDSLYVNILRNIKHVLQTPSIARFKNIFQGIPIIIAGSGPSLNDDLEHIKALQHKCVVIAAGSSIQPLYKAGITPDLIVSMDAGRFNEIIFKEGTYNHIPLLYFPVIAHPILDIHNEYNIHALYNNDEATHLFYDVIQNDDIAFSPSFSVTGSALQAAQYFGATEIILVGQDLSYPNKQLYAQNVGHINKWVEAKYQRAMSISVTNVKGEQNPTTVGMLNTLRDIEKVIASLTDCVVYNSSSQGALIEGTITKTLKQYFDDKQTELTHKNKPILLELLKEKNESENRYPWMKERVKYVKDYIQFTENELPILLKDLERLVQYSASNKKRAVQLLNKIELKWEKISNHLVYKLFIVHWMVKENRELDLKLLMIKKEQQIDQKAIQLSEALGLYISQWMKVMPRYKEEILSLADLSILK